MLRSIVEGDVLPRCVRKRYVVHELAGLVRRLERMIGREHHAVEAERGDRAVERLGRTHAGGRHKNVLPDVLRRRLAELEAVEFGRAVGGWSGAGLPPPNTRTGKVPPRGPSITLLREKRSKGPPTITRSACEPV